MNNPNALAVQDRRDTRLALSQVGELTNLANKLMKFPPHGPLTAPQAATMAAMSFMLDADPYNDELYATKTGIQKGIMLYRRKAQRYARQVNGGNYSVRFRKPEEGEIDFDPTRGDSAIVCELIDTEEHRRWENRWSTFFNDLFEASKDYKYADQRATMLAGPEPIHIGYGIVDGREKFSKEDWDNKVKDEDGKWVPGQKPEMMVREQRRNKRAEKAALKSAYPDLMARLDGSHDDFDLEQVVNVVIKEVELKQLTAPAHKQEGWTEQGALADLGFTDEPDRTYDIADDSPEITGQDQSEVVYVDVDPDPDPDPDAECKFGDRVVDKVLAANVGIKDRTKLINALNRSNFLAPAMEIKWYKMWANFYAQARKSKDQDGAAEHADNNIANIMAQSSEE